MGYPFFILLGLLIAASVAGAWFLYGLSKRVDKIFGGTSKGSDENVQTNIMKRVVRLETKVEESEPQLDALRQVARRSIHHLGFLRFNPFDNTGGDNSFVLALLDAEGNGVVISSLFARESVRIYGKAVTKGMSQHPLSEEEKQAIADAMRDDA